jgi:hypothetical protein
MITIKKLNKKYGSRKIQVFEDNKKLGEITECWHWIAIPRENHEILRKIAMENLWWLLHSDHINEDYTEQEAWEGKIDSWDHGRVAFHTSNTSVFHDNEKEIALNSINNR